ncbi:MAG: hypothetical protein AAF748_00575 [Pseudomonadota bacterium]
MHHTQSITYLPLTRRVGLVRAFAALVGAQPRSNPLKGDIDVPDYLRVDLGLPPVIRTRKSTAPPQPHTRWLMY